MAAGIESETMTSALGLHLIAVRRSRGMHRTRREARRMTRTTTHNGAGDRKIAAAAVALAAAIES
jgi:hypothetical protein